jgi:NAD(P)H dehydrogenase (quinone)
VKVLVIGAAGDLGGRVLAALRERDVETRAFVRREGALASVDATDAVLGDLGDPDSILKAAQGTAAMFLVSSPTRDQMTLETNAIDAAVLAGIERVVKISNIPIAGLETGLHANHRAIERRLAAAPIASVVIQPSFFSSVIERQRDLLDNGRIVFPIGAGKIAWIDPDDIADVAAAALARDEVLAGPLHITGPEALDGDEVAARLGVRRLNPPLDVWRAAAVDGGLDPWLADSTVHLYEAVAHGALEAVTDTVPRVLGRPARVAFPL